MKITNDFVSYAFIVGVISIAIFSPLSFDLQNHVANISVVQAWGNSDGGCCGGGGRESHGRDEPIQHKTVVVRRSNPRPTCTLSVTPDTIDRGDTVTLTWTTSNATSVTINQGIGSVALNGSKVRANIQANTTFKLTANGAAGTEAEACEDTVIVRVPPKPVCDLSVSPGTINRGDSVTLSWSTTNATSVIINQGIGSVPVDGSITDANVQQNTTYTLTAYGDGGSVTCRDSVIVRIPPQSPTCDIWANPAHVQYDGSTTLSWISENATSASLNHGIGSVASNGSKYVDGITNNRTYVLTVTGPGGSATCDVPVTVFEIENPSCDISAHPSRIDRGGHSTLTWDSRNATSATLSNDGSVSLNGSRAVSPYNTTTYTLTVRNAQGRTASCNTTVYVEEQERPTCWINLQNYYYSASQVYDVNYNYGGSTGELKWGSSNATSAHISPNVGSVNTNGSTTVYPGAHAQTYTMTVYGPGGTATCQTSYNPPPVTNLSCSIYVSQNTANGSVLSWNSNGARSSWLSDGIGAVAANGSLTVRPNGPRTYVLTVTDYSGRTATCQTFVQNTVTPYVALTQIPYTGFGDMGTIALYWLSVIGVSIFGAYMLAQRTNIFQNSFATSRGAYAFTAEEEEVIETQPQETEQALSFSSLTQDRMVVSRTGNGAPTLSILRS